MERVKGLTWNPKGYWQLAYKPMGRKRTSTKLGGLTRTQEAEANQRAREFLEQQKAQQVTVSFVIAQYRKNAMPKNPITRRNYECLLKRIEAQFGPELMAKMISGVVGDWINNLTHFLTGEDLAPGTKAELRNQFTRLWDYVIAHEMIPGVTQFSANPMSRVKIPDATMVIRKTKSMTIEVFVLFVPLLSRPFRTIFLLGMAHALRISEVLGFKWQDLNWFTGKLKLERRIARGKERRPKTEDSEKEFTLDPRILAELKAWYAEAQYKAPSDWMFASLFRKGKAPINVRTVETHFTRAAKSIGLKRGNTHLMRHSNRWWMRLKNIPEKVQQEAMRMTNLDTLQRYGNDEMPEVAQAAQGEVADLMFEALDEIEKGKVNESQTLENRGTRRLS